MQEVTIKNRFTDEIIICGKYESIKDALEKHRGSNLSGSNLSGSDLSESNLSGSNLSGSDMRRSDMRRSDLSGSNLSGSNLSESDMRGSNLDFACWPLWCGSFDVQIDARIFRQLAYHLCRTEVDDPECIEAQNYLMKIANKFHRVDECGKIQLREVK